MTDQTETTDRLSFRSLFPSHPVRWFLATLGGYFAVAGLTMLGFFWVVSWFAPPHVHGRWIPSLAVIGILLIIAITIRNKRT
jgi:hypothetical protein